MLKVQENCLILRNLFVILKLGSSINLYLFFICHHLGSNTRITKVKSSHIKLEIDQILKNILYNS